MAAAARTVSQIFAHMAIGFTVTYTATGSVMAGGMAVLLEPVINVMAVPFHERLWARLRCGVRRAAWLLAGEKFSQTPMHMAIAFAVMFSLTGSVTFGGPAGLLEPICNVLLIPWHGKLWQRAGAGCA